MDLTIGCSISSSSSITNPVTSTSSWTVELHYHCSLILNVVILICISLTSPSRITSSVIIVLMDIIISISSITSPVTSTSSITVALY